MKVWIRNQDKTKIVLVNDLRIEEITNFNPNNNLTINVKAKVVGARLLVNGCFLNSLDTLTPFTFLIMFGIPNSSKKLNRFLTPLKYVLAVVGSKVACK